MKIAERKIYALEVDHDGWSETLFEGSRKECEFEYKTTDVDYNDILQIVRYTVDEDGDIFDSKVIRSRLGRCK